MRAPGELPPRVVLALAGGACARAGSVCVAGYGIVYLSMAGDNEETRSCRSDLGDGRAPGAGWDRSDARAPDRSATRSLCRILLPHGILATG